LSAAGWGGHDLDHCVPDPLGSLFDEGAEALSGFIELALCDRWLDFKKELALFLCK
jgi:hypothetical protein